MIPWLRIDSEPPVALYRDPAALAYIDCAIALPALVSLGVLRRPLSRPNFVAGETANMSASLDNADGTLSREFAVPPLRAPARVMVGDTPVFAGLVTDIDLSAAASITLETGLRQPLSATLPLRSSMVWGSYRDVHALPIVYGRATLAPVQYSQDRRLWLVADHPIQGVDRVTRDEVSTAAWAWTNTPDSTGHPVAILELAEPLAEGEGLAVTLRGRMHPAQGTLLTRPDEVLWDILANICGLDVTLADLDTLRADAGDIEIGGVLDDAGRTVRAQIDIILASVGAAWSAGMPGVAIAWPPSGAAGDAEATFDRIGASDLRPVASEADLATVLRVLYDYDHAAGRHRQALQLEAPDAVVKYGRIEREIDAGWLRAARHADALGRAHLAWAARPVWSIAWRGTWRTDLPPGAWVEIDYPNSPVTGRHRLIQADMDMDRGSLALAISVPAGPAPAISAARLSTTFDPMIQAGATVDYRAGMAAFTIQDEQGAPLAGATVTLDGQARRLTDAAGRVSFPTARGAHVLHIQASGYADFEIEVTL